MRQTVDIKGLTCRSCEIKLEDTLSGIEGVKKVKVSHSDGRAVIESDAGVPDEVLRDAVGRSGYQVGRDEVRPWLNLSAAYYRDLAVAALIVAAMYYVLFRSGIVAVNFAPETVDLSVAALVGVIGGVSTCMAMVGGLILGFAAKYAKSNPDASAWSKFRPHLAFNLGRLVGFAFFGALLGLIGSIISLSPFMVAALTLIVGVVLLLLGFNMTELSPKLHDRIFALPKSWFRRLGGTTSQKSYTDAGAALVGALTFFLPCGFTQAMQVYAVASGTAWGGMLIMTAFALGAAPPLMGIGGLASVLRGHAGKLFYLTAGVAVLLMGALNIKVAGSLLLNYRPAELSESVADGAAEEVQVIRTVQSGTGYYPEEHVVKRGVPVRWIIESKTEFTCSSSIVVPQLGISRSLKLGENVIEFTPTENMDISFSCASGLFDGRIKVVD